MVRQEKVLNISKENVIEVSMDKMTQYLKFTLQYNREKKGKKEIDEAWRAEFG